MGCPPQQKKGGARLRMCARSGVCQRENDIVRSLSFISYTSPSDVVTVEVPDESSDHDEEGGIDDEFNALENPKKKKHVTPDG